MRVDVRDGQRAGHRHRHGRRWRSSAAAATRTARSTRTRSRRRLDHGRRGLQPVAGLRAGGRDRRGQLAAGARATARTSSGARSSRRRRARRACTSSSPPGPATTDGNTGGDDAAAPARLRRREHGLLPRPRPHVVEPREDFDAVDPRDGDRRPPVARRRSSRSCWPTTRCRATPARYGGRTRPTGGPTAEQGRSTGRRRRPAPTPGRASVPGSTVRARVHDRRERRQRVGEDPRRLGATRRTTSTCTSTASTATGATRVGAVDQHAGHDELRGGRRSPEPAPGKYIDPGVQLRVRRAGASPAR